MDLDNLKKTWQQTNVMPNLEEANIEQMLNNKTKGSYAQLLNTEKMFLWLVIIIAIFGSLGFLLVDYRISILYCIILGISAIWQNYKVNYLKKMNTLEMGIVQISQHINRYRKFMYYEMIGGFPLTIVFVVLVSLILTKPKSFSIDSLSEAIIFTCTVLIPSILIVIPIYKFLYLRNIKNIEKSIAEVKEFEKED